MQEGRRKLRVCRPLPRHLHRCRLCADRRLRTRARTRSTSLGWLCFFVFRHQGRVRLRLLRPKSVLLRHTTSQTLSSQTLRKRVGQSTWN